MCYSATLGETYGRLYSWHTAMSSSTEEGTQGIAPDGWHIPSDSDWNILFNYLGGVDLAGGAMKETGTEHWISPNTGATNSSGFNGLPGGGGLGGGFDGLGIGGHFISSSGSGLNTTIPTLHANYRSVLLLNKSKELLNSLRCVRDN
ncbi:FISUMP domain-containing protein [Bacteroidota bacterium]